ncbi:MAG TPA: cation:proton antiporter [Opitutaceae bacterium]
MHDISLITTIAFGLLSALVFGLLAKRLGLAPIVGYLLAGVVVGPFTPGFVGDVNLAKQLAEIGVILLMFGVGLHFHFDDLMAVRKIAVPGALGQSAAATLCGVAVTVAVGWTWNAGLVLGIAISVASTVVLLRLLMDHGMVETTEGRVAVGWLVVEDIITVLVLVLLPALATSAISAGTDAVAVAAEGEGSGLLATAGIAVLKLGVLAAIVGIAGSRFVPWLLLRVARLRSSELFTLTVLVIALAIATIGYLAFGASMALGAFLAGMVVSQSKFSHQAAADALPMRDAFSVLFFVSVGMLFDWRQILEEPWLVAGLVVVIMVVKPVVALVIALVGRHPLRTGLTVAAGLAQIGEFSFIVAEAARALDLMPEAGHHALVAAAIISISLNPWLFRRIMALEGWAKRQPKLQAWLDQRTAVHGAAVNDIELHRAAGSAPRAIVVGYGPVGRTIVNRAKELGLEPFVIDLNVDTILALQAEKIHALYGDASRRDILSQAGIKTASRLVITIPDNAAAVSILTAAREMNPDLGAIVRARYSVEGPDLTHAGADAVFSDEAEVATALAIGLMAHVKAGQAT